MVAFVERHDFALHPAEVRRIVADVASTVRTNLVDAFGRGFGRWQVWKLWNVDCAIHAVLNRACCRSQVRRLDRAIAVAAFAAVDVGPDAGGVVFDHSTE